MLSMRPDPEIRVQKITIPAGKRRIPALVLSPSYTFVGDGEPFYAETVQYIENLKKSGIPASVDVYHSDMHAFDMMQPDTPLSLEAARRFNEQFTYAQAHYFAAQGGSER